MTLEDEGICHPNANHRSCRRWNTKGDDLQEAIGRHPCDDTPCHQQQAQRVQHFTGTDLRLSRNLQARQKTNKGERKNKNRARNQSTKTKKATTKRQQGNIHEDKPGNINKQYNTKQTPTPQPIRKQRRQHKGNTHEHKQGNKTKLCENHNQSNTQQKQQTNPIQKHKQSNNNNNTKKTTNKTNADPTTATRNINDRNVPNGNVTQETNPSH